VSESVYERLGIRPVINGGDERLVAQFRLREAARSSPFGFQCLDPLSQLPGPVLQVFGLFLQIRDEAGWLGRWC